MLDSTYAALEEVELTLENLEAAWDSGGGGGVPRPALRSAGARLASMRRSGDGKPSRVRATRRGDRRASRLRQPVRSWLFGFAVPIATAALARRFVLRRFLIGDDRKAGSR